MNQAIKKIVSLFLLIVFLSGSGAGQVVHSIFHKHPVFESSHASVVVSSPHTYCSALQLMLPEFSGTTVLSIHAAIVAEARSFANSETSILCAYFIKTSDRAPPVLS